MRGILGAPAESRRFGVVEFIKEGLNRDIVRHRIRAALVSTFR
jgi:hypothetical protein